MKCVSTREGKRCDQAAEYVLSGMSYCEVHIDDAQKKYEELMKKAGGLLESHQKI